MKLKILKKIIKDVCNLKNYDGVKFGSHITIEKIKEDAEYEGVRARFIAHIASARIRMQLDIGFGDVLIPGPQKIEYPTLLKMPVFKFRGYPKEMVVAEKFHALTELGLLNSRLKDFYDLWFLSRRFDFDGKVLSRAVKETFARRKTVIDSAPVALTEVFHKNTEKQAQWRAFVNRTRLSVAPADFDGIVKVLASFLMPIAKAISEKALFKAHWTAPGPWVT